MGIVDIYKSDVVLHGFFRGKPPLSGGERGDVKFWSEKSRRRLAFYAANTDAQFVSMITLTYPAEFPANGETCKRHLNTFLSWLRRRNQGLDYLWFFEFQKRGAPHFHILTTIPSGGLSAVVSARWYAIVDSGDEKHLLAGTRCERLRTADGGKRYALKYAAKMGQKSVPEGFWRVGRFWGASRGSSPKKRRSELVGNLVTVKQRLASWERVGVLDDGFVAVLYGASESYEKTKS